MILEETINKLLRDVINLLLGISEYTIKAKQKDAPRPKTPYGDVDIVSDLSIGWEQRNFVNNGGDPDLTETIEGMREIMMSVNFYRDSAVDKARAVRTGLIRESIQEIFRAGKLGLIRRSDVREISEALENGWEERAQFDIVLSAVGSDSDIVRAIEAVNIAVEFQARGLKYNFIIEVQ